MNKSLMLAAFMFLISIPLVSATPVINSLSVQPVSSWIGENINISLSCSDSLNNSISQVYTNIVGPGIVLPTLYFTGNGNYQLTVSKDYLDRTGQYNATVYCKNNISETTSQTTSFTVSRLSGYINDVKPSPAYIGDDLEIDFIVEKDTARISSGVIFNVSLNDVLKNLKVVPAYDSIRGWILKLASPGTAAIYDIDVVAFYNGTSVSDSYTVDIRNSVEFEIVSIDKTWIKSNDNITVRLRALERGIVIELDENNVDIKIGGGDSQTTDVSRQGDNFIVKVNTPALSSGKYQLDAYLSYKGHSYSDSRDIDCVVTISGDMVDINNRVISSQIKFIQAGVTKLTVSNDAYGHYSGSIPPGTYDIEVVFPKSKLKLIGVLINSFDDPISYFYGDDFEIVGIRNAGLYSYDIDLSYSSVEIEMDYSEKNILDENDLNVYKCSGWNSGKKVCNDEWVEIGYDIDTVRNSVKVISSTLSAFVIGELKDITVDFGFDKDIYYLNDKVKVAGIAKDIDGNSIDNASVNVYVKNTDKNYNVFADNNGVFSVEFTVPEDEGSYMVVLKAKKSPFNDFKEEKSFKVERSRSIYIDFPESVKIARGKNFTQEFSLLNNGQADVNEIKISLDGIPENYYKISSNNIDLKSDEKRSLYIDFFIPVYAETGVSSAALKVENGNISEEMIFGFNIFEEGESEPSPTTGMLTGFTIPEIGYLEITYIVLFAVICFSIAIILKKRKVNRKRDEIKNFLFSIGGYVNNYEKGVGKKKPESYDKLIITEFPNVMKFSKELIQQKKGDK